MDRFVKNFILASLLYLVAASALGVLMLLGPRYQELRFVHSHFMLLGWVSMMIYGVGYHILPRFAGRLLKSTALGELHFWLANLSLLGMVGAYTWGPRALAAAFGALQVASIGLFFYNMLSTVFAPQKDS
jgi:cbb3-type cytochrome oxidase subunit 1